MDGATDQSPKILGFYDWVLSKLRLTLKSPPELLARGAVRVLSGPYGRSPVRTRPTCALRCGRGARLLHPSATPTRTTDGTHFSGT